MSDSLGSGDGVAPAWVWRDVLVVVGLSLLVALAVNLGLAIARRRQSRPPSSQAQER